MQRLLTALKCQSGVLPYHWHAQQLDVLLITSRHRVTTQGGVESFALTAIANQFVN